MTSHGQSVKPNPVIDIMTVPLISRRSSLGLLGGALALAACQGDRRQLLIVGGQKAGTQQLMESARVLDNLGYEIDWATFPTSNTLLEAIASGAVDVGLVGDSPFQFAFQTGSSIKAVSAQRPDPRPTEAIGIIVPQNSKLRNFRDLIGKRVAVSAGSGGHYLILRALQEANLPLTAIQMLMLSPSDAKSAFSSGSVDAWATWTPYLTVALQDGARVLVEGQPYYSGYCFQVSNKERIAKKRALLKDFLRREALALNWAVSHLDAYAHVMAKTTGLPPNIARIMAAKNERRPVPIDAEVIDEQRSILRTFQKAGAIKTNRPVSDAFEDLS